MTKADNQIMEANTTPTSTCQHCDAVVAWDRATKGFAHVATGKAECTTWTVEPQGADGEHAEVIDFGADEAGARACYADYRKHERTFLKKDGVPVLLGHPTKYELQGEALRADRARHGMHLVR